MNGMKRFRYYVADKAFSALIRQDWFSSWIRLHMPPGEIVSLIRKNKDNRDAPFYGFSIFAYIERLMKTYDRSPKRILEVGPGVNLGTLFCFACDKTVERITGLDISALSENPVFYQRLHRFLACTCYYSWWSGDMESLQAGGTNRYPHSWKAGDSQSIRDRIEYFSPYSITDLPFESDSFDLIYSMAVLEHFDDPTKAVREMKRVLSRNGIMIHSIDLAYHYGAPLTFLKWSEPDYLSRVQTYDMQHGLNQLLDGDWEKEAYCNRLRYSDWKEIFQNEGLQIVDVIDMAVLEEANIQREDYVEPFRSKKIDDLKVISPWFILKKV